MSNHLNNLLESIDEAPIFLDHINDTQDILITDTVKELAKQCVCFDAGDIDELANYKIIEELLVLPYPAVWIEHTSRHKEINMINGFLMYKNKDDINYMGFVKIPGLWRFIFAGRIYHEKEKTNHEVYLSKPGTTKQQIASIIRAPLAFISALNCTNVIRKEHTPDNKLQKARAKRGKQPLFSYWTLEIDLPKYVSNGECHGGTHSSPRLHLRRGHPRQYGPGKYCWVQPCIVGNKNSGMVHKDYSARYAG